MPANPSPAKVVTQRTAPPSCKPGLLTYKVAAQRLSVSLNHLRSLISSGNITAVAVGSRGRRVRADDIDAIVLKGVEAHSKDGH